MQCAVCSVQCAACSVQRAVCSVQCAVCSVQCSVQCALAVRRSPLAACSLPFAVCRVPFADRSWLLADFVDDASPVKLRTAQFGSRHTGRCIAYLLDFIYLELASVSKDFAEALGCINLFTKFVEGVHTVNVACTHDFEFLDDVTRLWLRLQKF